MSFFDEGDEPTRATRARPARPRRPAPGGGGGRGPGGRAGGTAGGPTAEQQILIRRLVALGVGLLLLILIVFGINGCLDSRKKNSLKDYNREVSAIVAESDQQVSRPLFELLNAGKAQADDLEPQINQLRLIADEDVKKANNLDVPGDMQRAQDDLELVLNLRATAIQKIGDRIRSALVTGRDNAQTSEDAVRQIAGQMQAFLASDVVYSQRVAPYIRDALSSNGVSGQTIATSKFLPSIGWLDPDQIAGKLGSARAGGGTGANPNPAPGLHGHGLTSVTVGGTTLQPGGAVNRLSASGNPTFTVSFQNQGTNDEADVVVRVTISGAGKPITAKKTVNQTKAGSAAQVAIPLGTTPPIGQPVTIDVGVEPVPGEKKTDNNKATYTAIFSR